MLLVHDKDIEMNLRCLQVIQRCDCDSHFICHSSTSTSSRLQNMNSLLSAKHCGFKQPLRLKLKVHQTQYKYCVADL